MASHGFRSPSQPRQEPWLFAAVGGWEALREAFDESLPSRLLCPADFSFQPADPCLFTRPVFRRNAVPRFVKLAHFDIASSLSDLEKSRLITMKTLEIINVSPPDKLLKFPSCRKKRQFDPFLGAKRRISRMSGTRYTQFQWSS
jgi:hypothetical protein